MSALYNEIDEYTADWLENLIAAGHIAPGRVERRSIRDLTPKDLEGVTQFHAFAGIGIWSHALRVAGFADDLEVWSGSCPCQPFSQAGHGKGLDDERHLWPEWFRLIRECRPAIVVGEQVSSPDGLAWFDVVSSDLEGAGYAVAAIDICAASVGAPHIRQRLYFVAVRLDVFEVVVGDAGLARGGRHAGGVPCTQGKGEGERERVGNLADLSLSRLSSRHLSLSLSVADHNDARRVEQRSARVHEDEVTSPGHDLDGRGATSVVADDHDERRGPRRPGREDGDGSIELAGRGATRGFWADCDWVYCRDGKWRPVERIADYGPDVDRNTDEQTGEGTTQPRALEMVDGSPAWLERVRAAGPLVTWEEIPDPKPRRTGMLKAYGNAIVAQVAKEFISAVIDVLCNE